MITHIKSQDTLAFELKAQDFTNKCFYFSTNMQTHCYLSFKKYLLNPYKYV